MNLKAAYRATGFMFLPTAAFLAIVFCWFFNWTAFVDFVTSQSGWAGFFRIVVAVAEFLLWYFFYTQYCEQYANEKTKTDIISMLSADGTIIGSSKKVDDYYIDRYVEQLKVPNADSYHIYDTPNPTVKIVKVKLKQP